jgi:predicted site-specific integrase-resolvase
VSNGLRCAIYARESSSENKAAMISQMDGLTEFAKAKGWQIVSINDLMEDLIAILTSFAARAYGQRRGGKKTKAAIKALQETE